YQTPTTHPTVASAPRHRSGGASGMLGTARLLGQSTGAALVALLFNLLGNNGTHTALLLAGTLAIVAALISGLRVTQPRAA
ncbi:MFS transporter, partial [Klebsiella pneumoniae]